MTIRPPEGFEETQFGPYSLLAGFCPRCDRDIYDVPEWLHPDVRPFDGRVYCSYPMWKLVVIPVAGLNMSPGKLAAQAAHVSAALWHLERTKSGADAEWFSHGMKTIVLEPLSLRQLKRMSFWANEIKLPNLLWWDRGMTEIEDGYTVLGIGPALDVEIDSYTGHLELYKPVPWWAPWRKQ